MLGYRGNVDKGDNYHYSSHTNVSLSKFNTCYECHYKASIDCRRENRNILLSWEMISDSSEWSGFLFQPEVIALCFGKDIQRLRLSETHWQIMVVKVDVCTFELTLIVLHWDRRAAGSVKYILCLGLRHTCQEQSKWWSNPQIICFLSLLVSYVHSLFWTACIYFAARVIKR